MTAADRRAVATWLLACAALVFALVVVGGITRLTRSGLSIVEWQPVIGAIPPLSDAEWETLFAGYRRTPEFQHVNAHIDLAGFKRIFWWEYVHRLLARLVGVAFLGPFLWLLARGRIERPLVVKLAGVFALGALQGALGWFMVQSGLVDVPRVSPVRLAAHLGLALAIIAVELWLALGLLAAPARRAATPRLARFAAVLVAAVFVMALTGGVVAGLHAGHVYNTFPLMGGYLVPPEVLALEPWWRNFLENSVTVQLAHRAVGWLLIGLVPLFWWQARAAGLEPGARWACHLLLAVLVLQVSLGIATLLLHVPLVLAVAHQAGAVLLLATAVWSAHALRSRP